VLIDLKMGQLTHQDLGQMQMYVNYYTRELMNEGDTPPIGMRNWNEKLQVRQQDITPYLSKIKPQNCA